MSGATRITGSEEFATYEREVPPIGRYCGGPSKFGVKVGPFVKGIVAVCGIVLEIAASRACGVPATVGSTAPAGVCGGMCAKSGGSALLGTKVQGPVRAAESNQRPDISRQ